MPKILVIEDDAMLRKSIAKLLGREHYEVTTAENGLVGLNQALRTIPDLILCDILMPEMDGYEVLKTLREKAPEYFIPFIFVTAKDQRQDIRQGMYLGADDYLTKPFTREELLTAVQRRLEKNDGFQAHYFQKIQELDVKRKDARHFDPITKLPNARFLEEQFKFLVHEFESERLHLQEGNLLLPFFVLRLGLRLDELAVSTYQQLLQAIADRVQQHQQLPQSLILLKDDQFVILCQPQGKRRGIKKIVQSLGEYLQEPFTIAGETFTLKPKIGVSLYGTDGYNLDQLIQKGCQAAQALVSGESFYQFYSLTMNLRDERQDILEQSLAAAIAQQQIQVFYQPQINLQSKEITGIEALARWQHPHLGTISPREFIPIAEKMGLIEEIGLAILERALQDVQTWRQHYNAHLRLAVNFSARQLHQANLSEAIAALLDRYQFPANQLDIEVTEATLITNFTDLGSQLERLQGLGLRIVMDDFGTGYSSLNYVQLLPWNVIKLDRVLISGIEHNLVLQTLLPTIISDAHNLGYIVVAEGVETEGELKVLNEYACDLIQGFLIGKPMPAADLTEMLATAMV